MKRRWFIVVLALVSGAAAQWAGSAYQAQARAARLHDVEARARAAPPPAVDPAAHTTSDPASGLVALPPPVARYLRHALPADAGRLRVARLWQSGLLRTATDSTRWLPFSATQLVAPELVEFVWEANVAAAPLIDVQVSDALVQGTGSGEVTLLSALPLASAAGGAEMNEGSLHRFLAEAVWYPWALRPSAMLRWTAVDDTRAVATLRSGTSTVSLEFRFNAAGEVTGVYTPARWGRFDGGYRQVAWEGMFRRYQRRHGVLVPTEGEVGWHVDGRWQSVWKGTLLRVVFEIDGR